MARARDARLRRVYEQASPDDGHQAEADRPGDPACWLKRVCPSCGSIADADPPTTCPSCRAAIPAQ